MPLSDTKVKNAKATDKQQKHFDGDGLFLLVTTAGGKHWKLKYRDAGKEKQLALGEYPAVSIADARKLKDAAREQLAKGIDPSTTMSKKAKKAEKIAGAKDTFEAVAREWHTRQSPSWAPKHSNQILRYLEINIFPVFGSKPIAEIKAPEILRALQEIENRGAVDLAKRVNQCLGQIFRYASVLGKRVNGDPTSGISEALQDANKKHYAAITEPDKVALLLRAIDKYEGGYVVKQALRFAPLVFVRPGELRNAEWSEIDLEKAEWNIPAEKMKKSLPLLVPLSSQAVAILKEIEPLTGYGRYVFPCHRDVTRPMSENGINAALRLIGFGIDEMSGHGFRAMARTILDEVLQQRPDLIEHQLAHAVRDANGRAYNRTSHLPERKKMMQLWSNYLEGLKMGAQVIPLRKQAC